MNKPNLNKKGQTGLSIFLSLIIMLFIIGLIVMIFSIMGGEIQSSSYDSTTVNIVNESVGSLNKTTGNTLGGSVYRNVKCTSITSITNATSGATVPSTNYTLTNCVLKGEANSLFLNKPVNVTYTYVWDADNTATKTMNDTVGSISSAVDWFDLFIVIGAMVVLILLTVLIITAIRGSGMVSGGSSPKSIGTA